MQSVVNGEGNRSFKPERNLSRLTAQPHLKLQPTVDPIHLELYATNYNFNHRRGFASSTACCSRATGA
jgi:hypothetical protein